jgi:hypothetical protein
VSMLTASICMLPVFIELDGDDAMLTDAHGRKATRDLVQFVKFNDFARLAPGRLAKETLAELPGQMMG